MQSDLDVRKAGQVSRPLTGEERNRIEMIRGRLEAAERARAEARQDLAAAIREIWERRGSVSELAEAAGLSRQGVYDLIRREGRR